MIGVLGLSTLSARANGKLGMTTVIEAGKMICYRCHAIEFQVCETIDVMVVGFEPEKVKLFRICVLSIGLDSTKDQ